jgi:beta-xylosidase
MVCQEDGSIDPFFVRHAAGRPYLIWKEDANSCHQPSTALAQPMTDDGLRVTGSPTPLIRSDAAWEGHVVEGRKSYGEFYFMLYAGGACCGRSCNYAMGVACAKNLLGPWEKSPAKRS